MYSKRLIASLCAGIVLALGLCGCSSKTPKEDVSVSETAEVSKETKVADDTEESTDVAEEKTAENNKTEIDDAEPEETASETKTEPSDIGDNYFLKTDGDDLIVFLNEDGSVRKVVELTGDLAPEEQYGDFIESVCGNKIMYRKGSRTDNKIKELYLYDVDKETWSFVDETEDSPYVTLVGDDIYIDYNLYDIETGKSSRSTIFYKNNNDGTFDKTENVYAKLNELCTEEDYIIPSNYYGNNRRYSISYCVNEFGKVPFYKDNFIYIYDENGDLCNSYEEKGSEKIEIKAFDGNYVVYERMDSLYFTQDLNIFELATGETRIVRKYDTDSSNDYYRFLCFEDGVIYYAYEDTGGEHNVSTVYAYDIAREDTSMIISEESKAGHHYFADPLINIFKVIDGKAYFPGEGDDTTEWFCAERKDGEWVCAPLGVIVREYSFGEYGDIESYTCRENCPYCGKLCYKDYYEWLVLDEAVLNADKINESIRKEMEERRKNDDEYEPNFTEYDCENFLHNDSFDMYDNEALNVDDVRTVFDRYLFIERSGYTYSSGAAHGYPIEANMLFDLTTGEEVWLRDVFRISENTLKEVVASCAKEQYDELSNRVTAANADALYDQVYEEMNMDFSFVTFYDSYLTFDFQPYDLGSFAGGTISISVPYVYLR